MPRILCLDIEGGHGGSSRSLYFSLRHMDKSNLDLEVWCRRPGPIQDRYAAIGIPTRVFPNMPKVTSVGRLSRNLALQAGFMANCLVAKEFKRNLAMALSGGVDIVHLNHESLFELGRWIKANHPNMLITAHVRTRPPLNWFSRRQAEILTAAAKELVYITENEQMQWSSLLGRKAPGHVIYNIVEPLEDNIAPHPALPEDGRFKVLSLGNYDPVRGIDRVLEVAAAIKAKGRRDLLFVFAGDTALRGNADGLRPGPGMKRLEDVARSRGIMDRCLFLGHVAEPERVLAGCDALIKLTREANPWGRDILEAMAAGLPILTIGSYDRLVETDVTGILLASHVADEAARALIRLADDKPHAKAMGIEARTRIARLCDGPTRAAELRQLWEETALRA